MNYANAGAAIASGDVVVIGKQIAIAAEDIAASTGEGSIDTEGVFSLDKAAGVLTQGNLCWWDGTAKNIVAAPTANASVCAGTIWESALSGDTKALVKIGGDAFERAAKVDALAGTMTGTVAGTMVDVAGAAGACAGTTTPSASNVDTAIATAIAPLVTSTNLGLKELQTQLNAALAALKAAGLMSS